MCSQWKQYCQSISTRLVLGQCHKCIKRACFNSARIASLLWRSLNAVLGYGHWVDLFRVAAEVVKCSTGSNQTRAKQLIFSVLIVCQQRTFHANLNRCFHHSQLQASERIIWNEEQIRAEWSDFGWREKKNWNCLSKWTESSVNTWVCTGFGKKKPTNSGASWFCCFMFVKIRSSNERPPSAEWAKLQGCWQHCARDWSYGMKIGILLMFEKSNSLACVWFVCSPKFYLVSSVFPLFGLDRVAIIPGPMSSYPTNAVWAQNESPNTRRWCFIHCTQYDCTAKENHLDADLTVSYGHN